jgi:tripartite-type tricarboxylate transporter receptor subunit TctC
MNALNKPERPNPMKTMTRRNWSLLLCLSALLTGTAMAQPYPAKPVRIVAAYAAGGGVDMMARLLAEQLTRQMGQSVVVENRPGAGGAIGAEAVAKSSADGYTLLAGGNPELTFLPVIQDKLGYDASKDFTPLMLVAQVPAVLVVPAASPIQTMAQFLERARSDKGLAYGTPGRGTPMHLAFELMNAQHGMRLVHVPYKGGGPATADVVAGQVESAVVNAPPLLPHIQSGKLRALAVLQGERSALLPGVPTWKEATGIDGVQAPSWFAMSAPAKLPADVRARLEEELRRAVNEPELKARLQKAGMDVMGTPGARMGQIMAAETVYNTALVKRIGYKPE